ncbi:hypothetical protein [Methanosarcina mazei]|uniref:hypothetical protein n=1 Tax=Methanosarcina mazei TaxID=2209 RepID=UPI00064FB94A|nr:hypothetical protein [Methanosarcina mazei]
MQVLETINCQYECGNCKVFVGCMEGIYRETDKEEISLESEINNLYKRGYFKVSVFGELIFTDCSYCEKNYSGERCNISCMYRTGYSSPEGRVQLSDSELLYDLVILRMNNVICEFGMPEPMKRAQEAYITAIADIHNLTNNLNNKRWIPKSAYDYVRSLESQEDEKTHKAMKKAKKVLFDF